jgi:hypothetical protein
MRLPVVLVVLVSGSVLANRAEAQFGVRDPAPGEQFNIELGAMFFQPGPELRIQTGQAVVGEVDFVEEFDIEDQFFTEFRIVGKPGRKHKIRFSYLAIHYDREATIQRTFTFGGRTFTVGVPATADLHWNLLKIGYEWDFVARDRGFVGLLAELKHNHVSADVAALGIGATTYETNAPVPAIGIIGRGYVHPLVAITAELSGFKVVSAEDFDVQLTDFDINGTVSVGRHVGLQGGYRSVLAEYFVDEDAGDLKLQGLYFGGVVRF